MPAEPVRAAGVLLITQDVPREFLLMRHPDRWDLPKGHCEPGESFRETALRELEEETGIAGDAVSLDDAFTFDLRYPVRYPDRAEPIEKWVRYFLGVLEKKFDPRPTEHDGFAWFAWSPPHRIQTQTIDPLLAAVAHRLESRPAIPASPSADGDT